MHSHSPGGGLQKNRLSSLPPGSSSPGIQTEGPIMAEQATVTSKRQLRDLAQMREKDRSEAREYAWRYFSLHADQRLKTFNFYLILVTVILSGVLAFVKDAKVPLLAAIPVILLLPLLSFVFYK